MSNVKSLDVTKPKRKNKPKPPVDIEHLGMKELYTLDEAAYLLSTSYYTVLNLTNEINPMTRKPWLLSSRVGKGKKVSKHAIQLFIQSREGVAS